MRKLGEAGRDHGRLLRGGRGRFGGEEGKRGKKMKKNKRENREKLDFESRKADWKGMWQKGKQENWHCAVNCNDSVEKSVREIER